MAPTCLFSFLFFSYEHTRHSTTWLGFRQAERQSRNWKIELPSTICGWGTSPLSFGSLGSSRQTKAPTSTDDRRRNQHHTECDIECRMVFNVSIVMIWMTLLMNKRTNIVKDDGWVHPLAKTLPSLVNNSWWNINLDDWKLDRKSLDEW